MDGCTRQNPAYRPANGRAPERGLFLYVLAAIAVALAAGPPGGPPGGALANAAAAEPDGWRPDVKRGRRYAKQRTGDVRFAIIDVNGRSYDFHGGRTAPMASTEPTTVRPTRAAPLDTARAASTPVTLPANAYFATGDEKYKKWVITYVDGWLADATDLGALRLVEAQSYRSGVVQLRYRP